MSKIKPQYNVCNKPTTEHDCPQKWTHACVEYLKKFCFPRWEAVYSSDEEGEAGGAETQAVGGLFYMQLETLS